MEVAGRPDRDRHRLGELEPHLLAGLLQPPEHFAHQPLLEELGGRPAGERRAGRAFFRPDHPVRLGVVRGVRLWGERYATDVQFGSKDLIALPGPRRGVGGASREEDELWKRDPRLDQGPLAELPPDLDQVADALHAPFEGLVAVPHLLRPGGEMDRRGRWRIRRVRELLVNVLGRERDERRQE